MLTERLFRSGDLPPADRFDCWRELVGRTHAPLEVLSDHRADFLAAQRVLDLGAVSVWPTTFQPVCFRRTPKLIRQSDPEGLHLSLSLTFRKAYGMAPRDYRNAAQHLGDSSDASSTASPAERTPC
ncbi:hypothetical protein ABT321_29800 [Streptomyces platensis]